MMSPQNEQALSAISSQPLSYLPMSGATIFSSSASHRNDA
jgi:hypothetical protein